MTTTSCIGAIIVAGLSVAPPRPMRRFFATDDSWVSFVQRVLLAVVFFPHGMQKLLGWFGGQGWDTTIGQFTAKGMPAVIAALVIIAESFGAIGLFLGFFTRLTAIGISAVMLGAIFLVHAKIGFFMNWTGQQRGEGLEYHLLALALSLPLIVTGAGAWSLDGLIARTKVTRHARMAT